MSGLDQLGPVARPRHALMHTRSALARREITVGFLGGSITASKTGTRWPEPFLAWLVDAHPGVRLTVENAALGATGSDLAVFRVQSEIIDRACDLVFVEYAVNDFDQPTARRNRTREGLLRQLAAAPCDVVLVYTFRAEMLPDMEAGRVPPSIAEFETLADHYGLTSIWMGLHSLREVQRGLLTWPEWLPDGLHPEQRGSLSYAQSVIATLAPALSREDTCAPATRAPALPPLLTPGAWQRAGFVPFRSVHLHGPWSVRRWHTCLGMDRALHSTAPGAGLSFDFEGRGLVLGFDFGRMSGEVRYRVDGGAWGTTQRERAPWVGDSGWFRPEVIAEDLPAGRHRFELETISAVHVGGIAATTTIAFFGVLQ
jgi:hypothetical protein